MAASDKDYPTNLVFVESNNPKSNPEDAKENSHLGQDGQIKKSEISASKSGLTANTSSSSDADLSRLREGRVISHASETFDSLKRQLDQKNEMITKYRLMLKTTRQEFMEKLQSKDVQISALQEKVQEFTMKEISRMSLQSSQNISSPIKEDNNDLQKAAAVNEEALAIEREIVRDLQQLIILKDEKLAATKDENERITQELTTLNKNADARKEEILNCAKTVTEQEKRLQDAALQESSQKEIIDTLQHELERAREILAIPSVPDLSDEVIRLQKDVDAKAKKINSFQKQNGTLQKQLSILAGELAESRAKESLVPQSNPQDIIVQERMATKIAHLEIKNKRLLENADALKKEKLDLSQEIEKLNDAWVKKSQEVTTLCKTIEIYKSPASSGKSIEQVIANVLAATRPHGNTSNWDIAKKEQQKADKLSEKLKLKTAEVESLTNLNTQLRSSLERSEKDRARLIQQLQSALKTIEDDQSVKVKGGLQNEQLLLLEEKVHVLQMALAKANSNFRAQNAKENSNHDHVIAIQQKYTDLQKEHSLIKSQLDESMDQVKSMEETMSTHVVKLTEENQKLRTRIKREVDRIDMTTKQLNSVLVENDGYKNEIKLLKGTVRVYSRESLSEDKTEIIRTLKAELEDKERAIAEMSATEGSTARLSSENRKLRRELEVMGLRVEKLSSKVKI